MGRTVHPFDKSIHFLSHRLRNSCHTNFCWCNDISRKCFIVYCLLILSVLTPQSPIIAWRSFILYRHSYYCVYWGLCMWVCNIINSNIIYNIKMKSISMKMSHGVSHDTRLVLDQCRQFDDNLKRIYRIRIHFSILVLC